MTWLLEASMLNPGYGLSRLTIRLHERFPSSQGMWNESTVNHFLGSHDHKNGTSLLDKLSVSDRSTGRLPFEDPGNHQDAPPSKTAPIEEKTSNKPNHSNLYGGLKDAKHKIAFLLLKNWNIESTDYYSGGSTVTLRYWKVLSEKLGLRMPANPSKKALVKLIFEECQVEHEFNLDLHTSSGSTITKTAFIDLCDHFSVNLPADLVGELDEHEEDFQITLHSVDPTTSAEMETIEQIVNKFVGGVIYVPAFQRDFRWPIKKQRELIDSILLGIPLPSILLIKADDGDWWLVDGRQRVTSLRRFIKPKDFTPKNTFHLGILTGENSRYTNMNFKELEESVQSRILNTKIPVTYIEGLSEHRSAIYELFRRYNTGGTNLNGAEIRNAVFHENAYHQELFRLAGEDVDVSEFTKTTRDVRKLIRISIANLTGFKAYDRICRYFGYQYASKGMTTANAIFKFFEDHKDSSIEEASKLTTEFIDSAKYCDKIFREEYRFKRIKEDGKTGGFGVWPYTIQMIGSTHLLHRYPDESNKIIGMRDKIIKLWHNFYMKEVFNVRQNSTTLWGSQIRWCELLDEFIKEEIASKSEYELVLDELHGMEPLIRLEFINMLADKEYFDKLVNEAEFQGWV